MTAMRAGPLAVAALAAAVLAPLAPARADGDPPAPPAGAEAPRAEPLPDPVAPPAELAAKLGRFDGEADPGRAVKRVFVSVLHYVSARDLERLVGCFHPDLRFHLGNGEMEAVPPASLRELFRQRFAAGEGPKVDLVATIVELRVYSRRAAREARPGGRGLEPGAFVRYMSDDDWLVIARLRQGDGSEEDVYQVLRRDGAAFKVVLTE